MRTGLSVLAAWAIGCGGEVPLASIEIGTGALDGSAGFQSFTDGADLTLAPGSQGGFHVFVNFRVGAELADAMGEIPVVTRRARRVSDGVLVSRNTRRVSFRASDGGAETEASLPLFLCPTPIGVEVGDELIRLEVEVATPDGEILGTGEATFVPRCPADAQAAFCANICFG